MVHLNQRCSGSNKFTTLKIRRGGLYGHPFLLLHKLHFDSKYQTRCSHSDLLPSLNEFLLRKYPITLDQVSTGTRSL